MRVVYPDFGKKKYDNFKNLIFKFDTFKIIFNKPI